MSNIIGASTFSDGSATNANVASPPFDVRFGAADRPSRSFTAEPHWAAESRHSRRGSGVSGVQEAELPPVPVPLTFPLPPAPEVELPPVDEAPPPVPGVPVPVELPPPLPPLPVWGVNWSLMFPWQLRPPR